MKSATTQDFRSGSVALIGRPNVGKSTLLNALVGMKLSITSAKPQTTRVRIRGILNKPDMQIVFVDTPGFQLQFKNVLNKAMNRGVDIAREEVDLLGLVVEAGKWRPEDQALFESLAAAGKTLVVIANKADKIQQSEMLKFLKDVGSRTEVAAIIPVSAQKRKGLDILLRAIREFMPTGEPVYSQEDVTDRSERMLAADFLREKLFRLLGDEIPYGVATVIDRFEEKGALVRIHASIIVDKAAHKSMVIGKGGEKLKLVATAARKDMEVLLGKKVHLETWVKVRKGWQDDPGQMKIMGYE